MADDVLLALFDDLDPVPDTVRKLRQMGLPDDRVTVMSSVPYDPQMLARPPVRDRMPRVALLGAILGLVTTVSLLAAAFLLYPVVQGGQPIVPIPPSLIIAIEVTLLGVMWTIFFGFFVVNRLPVFGRPVYNGRITLGKIGIAVRPNQAQALEVERVLREAGAGDLQRLAGDEGAHGRAWVRFALGVIGVLIIGTGIALLFSYDVLRISFPSQMVNQDSVGYVQGPRLAVPAQAIPVRGPVLIDDRPALEPVPATADSLQRGGVLYNIDCALCHGVDGTGDGKLNGFFTPPPADLTSKDVQELPDADIFLAITQGRGDMLALAENLSPTQRWDVINYIRSLQK
jgi:mono/diheme cytochrome c family protein